MAALNKIGKNSLYLLVLTISNYLIGLLVFPYISRVLSVENFGLVGFAMMSTLIFQSIVEYGFTIFSTAKISKCRESLDEVSKIVTVVMASKFYLILISSIVFLIAALFVQIIHDNFIFMAVFFCSGVMTALIPDFYFRGTENMSTIAIRALVSKLMSIAVIIVLVRSDAELLVIPAAFLLGNLISVLWSFDSMRRLGFKFTNFELSEVIGSLRDSFLFFLSRISATINQAAGAFALSLVYSGATVELGLYAAAWRIGSAGEMLLIPMADSLYPHMVKEKDYRLFWKIYSHGLILWFFCCLAVFLLADLLCEIILGPSYSGAADILRILLLGTFMAYSSIMLGYNALSPLGLEKHANFSLIISVLANVLTLSLLVLTGTANIWTISLCVASVNLFLVIYRAIVLFKNRDKLSGGLV